MQCENPKCPVKEWFYCTTCRKALRSNLKVHAYTKTHRTKTSLQFNNPNDPKYPGHAKCPTAKFSNLSNPNYPVVTEYVSATHSKNDEALALALVQKEEEEEDSE